MRKALLIITAVAVVLATAGTGLALAEDDAPDDVPDTERPAVAATEAGIPDELVPTRLAAATAANFAVHFEAARTIEFAKRVQFVADLEAEAARRAEEAARAAEQAARTSRGSSRSSGGGSASSGGGGGAGGRLSCIRNHESGGDYSTNTGNGYYGAYQFSQSTWESVGGTGNPADASPAEQDARAQQLLGSGGIGHWPNANC